MKALSIHLTDLCNSECTFCVVGSPLYTKDTIQYDQVVKFLEEHRDSGYDVVNLHGGEATIHPRFLETLDLILALGYQEIHLQTNAIRLASLPYVESLVARRVTKFIISLHGDTAELQDGQTFTRGGFDKTIAGIRHVKSCGAHVRTNTVITNQNLDRLPHIAQLLCDLQVDHVNLSNMHPVGSARFSRDRVMPKLEDIRRHLYPAVDLLLANGRHVTLEGFPYCAVGGGKERLHLTNEYRAIRLLVRGEVLDDYDSFMRDRMSVLGEACSDCRAKSTCGGVYPEYIEYFGWDEFDPTGLPDALELPVAAP